MVSNAQDLIADFVRNAEKKGFSIQESDIAHESLPAPHKRPSLPKGKCAVYVFSLTGQSVTEPPAGKNCVLKVGRVGPNSNPRFQHQHYKPSSAGSTLAGSVLLATDQWEFLGIKSVNADTVGEWLQSNTDRDHFYLSANNQPLLEHLEKFLRSRLRPVFEG
jgi:hypothetical protein